jgi:membrane glycosyltransferase
VGFNRNGSWRFGAGKSDSTHHFFGNACTIAVFPIFRLLTDFDNSSQRSTLFAKSLLSVVCRRVYVLFVICVSLRIALFYYMSSRSQHSGVQQVLCCVLVLFVLCALWQWID